MDQALTPKHVAERLQVSERTVLDLLRVGELPGRKVGGQWRVAPAALEAYMRGDSDAEPLTAKDVAAIREGLADIKAGRTVGLEELEAELAGGRGRRSPGRRDARHHA